MFRPEYPMIAMYVVAMGYYGAQREWNKVLYYLGATILTIGVLRMQG